MSNQVKILHVISGLSAGGAENMLCRIVDYASKHDLNSTHVVVSLKDGGTLGGKLADASIELHTLNIKGFSTLAKGMLQLGKIMRVQSPDVIMSWLYHADMFSLMACFLAGKSPSRLVWNLRCAYIDFSKYRWTTRLTVKILSYLSVLPGCVAYNSPAGKVVHENLGYRPKKWAYLPNGFDDLVWRTNPEARENKRAELNVPPSSPVIVMVARNDPAKDYQTFFHAANAILAEKPDCRFLCVGKDTERLALPDGLKNNFYLLGERKDIPAILNACDLFVLCSAFGEGFPNVVAEAMLTGLPCIVTDVWDAAPVLQDTGRVVPPANARSLAKAIMDILELPAEDRYKMGHKARKLIQENYGIQSSYEKYRALWSGMINKS